MYRGARGGKNIVLIIKSSLFQWIFINAKGLNCASLEIVITKKNISYNYFWRSAHT